MSAMRDPLSWKLVNCARCGAVLLGESERAERDAAPTAERIGLPPEMFDTEPVGGEA